MTRSRVRSALLAGAYAIVIALLGAALASLRIEARQAAQTRLLVTRLEDRLSQLRRDTDTAIEKLSEEEGDRAAALQAQIASLRRATRREVAGMGEGLSGRMDQMAQEVRTLASASTRAAAALAQTSEERAQGLAPPQATAPPHAPVSPHAPMPGADLEAARRMEEGRALFEAGTYSLAKIQFAAAAAALPGELSPRLYHAVSLYRSSPGDSSSYASIERTLHAVLQAEPDNPLALETLAHMDAERQRWTSALGLLRRLLVIQPGNTEAMKAAGECARRAGDEADAREYFTAAARQCPGDREAWTALGDCDARLGNAEEAEKSWEAALKLLDLTTAPGSAEGQQLYTKLAASSWARGDADKCLSCAEAGRRLGASERLADYERLAAAAVEASLTEVEP